MTKEDIISWAREAECEETFGMDVFRFTLPDLERFANLVAAGKAAMFDELLEALKDMGARYGLTDVARAVIAKAEQT